VVTWCLSITCQKREIDVTLNQLEGEGSVRPASANGDDAPAEAAKSSNALGLTGEELTVAQRRQMGLGEKEGVAIARVDGRAARQAGLRPGDVILRVGRTPVGTVAALDRALRGVKTGQTVMLLVRSRMGGTQFIAVTPQDGDK